MRSLRLSRSDFDNLVALLSYNKSVVSQLKDLSSEDDKGVIVALDDALRRQIGDMLTEELAVTGFDQKYELTPRGDTLESLIDIVNHNLP